MLKLSTIRDLAVIVAAGAITFRQLHPARPTFQIVVPEPGRLNPTAPAPAGEQPLAASASTARPESRKVAEMIHEWGGTSLGLEDWRDLSMADIDAQRANVRLLWDHLDEMSEKERDHFRAFILSLLRRATQAHRHDLIEHPANELFGYTRKEAADG